MAFNDDFSVTRHTQTTCIQDDLWKKKQVHIWSPNLQCKIEHERHFNVERKRNENVKVKMNTPENMAMSWRCLVTWFIPWMEEYFALRQKKIKNKKTSMSTDGDELTQGYWRVSLNKQLTECEWRRPLTWLDRFRDAVLLPASWRDENIQPHVGEKIPENWFFFRNQHFGFWSLHRGSRRLWIMW